MGTRPVGPLVMGNGWLRIYQYNVKATGHVAKLRRDLTVSGK